MDYHTFMQIHVPVGSLPPPTSFLPMSIQFGKVTQFCFSRFGGEIRDEPPDENLLRLPGQDTKSVLRQWIRYKSCEGKLWTVLGGHLQRGGEDGLERQLYGAKKSQDNAGEVTGALYYNPLYGRRVSLSLSLFQPLRLSLLTRASLSGAHASS